MLTSKRVDGDYSIVSTSGGTITLGNQSTDPVIIPGNLTVSGTMTTIDVVNLTVSDNIIIINDGEAGAGVTAGTSGLEVDRGSSLNASLLFDEVNDTWVVDKGTGTNVEIVTVAIGSPSPLFNIAEDTTPQLGADLDVNLNLITATTNNDVALTTTGTGDIVLTTPNTGNIRLDGPAVVSGPAPNTTPAAGDVAVYQGTDTGGGTQILFENNTDTGELVSKSKAIMFSLIF